MVARNLFCRIQFSSSIQGKKRFQSIFRPPNLYFYYKLRKKMFSEQLASCRGEIFMHALRSMIIDLVDFPWLDFKTYEILETIPRSIRFFLFPWLVLSVVSVYSFHRLQVDLNDLQINNGIKHETLVNKSRTLTSGHRLRMRKVESCKGQILETLDTRVEFFETQNKLFKKTSPVTPLFIVKIGLCGPR